VAYDGVTQTRISGGTQTIPASLPGSARFFVSNAFNSARSNVLDDLYIGPA